MFSLWYLRRQSEKITANTINYLHMPFDVLTDSELYWFKDDTDIKVEANSSWGQQTVGNTFISNKWKFWWKTSSVLKTSHSVDISSLEDLLLSSEEGGCWTMWWSEPRLLLISGHNGDQVLLAFESFKANNTQKCFVLQLHGYSFKSKFTWITL